MHLGGFAWNSHASWWEPLWSELCRDERGIEFERDQVVLPATALEISIRIEETDDAGVIVDAGLIVGKRGAQQPVPFVAIRATRRAALLIRTIGKRVGDFRMFPPPTVEAAPSPCATA